MSTPDSSALQGRTATILVVDDTPDSIGLLKTILESEGLRVLVANDGLAAIEILKEVTPDLILMDGVMPGMDGFETARRIKAESRFQYLPIIFVTGLSATEHIVRGFQEGGIDYVTKPIVIEELLARVRTHLASARIARNSHMALDITGRPSFGLDSDGFILWFTPMASDIIERLFPDWDFAEGALPLDLALPLGRLRLTDPRVGSRVTVTVRDSALEFTFLEQTPTGEWLFRLNEQRQGYQEHVLSVRHGLTVREAEVLLWVSRGKKNREVSEILKISPRTVSKHLEQVFEKLGVENRASAAGIAVSTLAG